MISREVMFHKKVAWEWGTKEVDEVHGIFIVEHLIIHVANDAGLEDPIWAWQDQKQCWPLMGLQCP